jgi:hypothetical protein
VEGIAEGEKVGEEKEKEEVKNEAAESLWATATRNSRRPERSPRSS